jgi:hypothetical protein
VVVAEELLYAVDLLLLFLVSIGALILFTELGFHIGRLAGRGTSEKARVQIGTIQGAILGLLALLLGFTFAMAMSRYEVRRQLVVDEANAIGTTLLRAQLLPDPSRREISELLRRYVQVRLDFYQADTYTKKLDAINQATNKLQTQLWSMAAGLGVKEPRAVTIGLFLQSLNELIDLHNKRLTALEDHVPEIILFLLYFVALVATGLIGYGCGLGGVRNFFITVVSSILIAAVIIVIIDLDRPIHGLIQVSQQRMLELRQTMEGK